MKTKAFFTVLSQKHRDGEVVFIDQFKFASPKTKEAHLALGRLAQLKGLEKINYRRGRRALLALPAVDRATWRSFRNLPGVAVEEARNLNPEVLLNYQYLLITDPTASLPLLYGRSAVKTQS